MMFLRSLLRLDSSGGDNILPLGLSLERRSRMFHLSRAVLWNTRQPPTAKNSLIVPDSLSTDRAFGSYLSLLLGDFLLLLHCLLRVGEALQKVREATFHDQSLSILWSFTKAGRERLSPTATSRSHPLLDQEDSNTLPTHTAPCPSHSNSGDNSLSAPFIVGHDWISTGDF